MPYHSAFPKREMSLPISILPLAPSNDLKLNPAGIFISYGIPPIVTLNSRATSLLVSRHETINSSKKAVSLVAILTVPPNGAFVILSSGMIALAIYMVTKRRELLAFQVQQVMSDINQEITSSQILYDIARSQIGITDTDQGKNDPSARSGKAKQLQMAASAQRNDAPNTQRNLAFAGVYELIFKNMLAYCR